MARSTIYPHPVDKHVGSKLKQKRIELGWSQIKLAAAVNLTFQQIQKYEKARNRVSISRLYDLAKVLNIDIHYFLDDFHKSEANTSDSTN